MFEIIDLDTSMRELKNRKGFLHIVDDLGICYFDSHALKGQQCAKPDMLEWIARVYKRAGRQCFDDICNAASVVLCDFTRGKLFVASDKIGSRTFYYGQKGRLLILSTEIRRIAEMVTMEISRDSLSMYLNLNFISGGGSIFRHTYKIPPSCYLCVEDGRASVHRYHSFKLHVSGTGKERLRGYLRKFLINSIRSYSKAELGLMLSGGFDSSLLCKLGTEVRGRIHTFTFVIEPYNTKTVAKSAQIARLYGTHHKEIPFTVGDYVRNFPLVAGYLEEPAFDRNLPIIWHLLNKVPRRVRFIMYGFGGDEIFGDRLERKFVDDSYRFSHEKKLNRIDKGMESIYLFLKTVIPQKILIHDRISEQFNVKITFPFLDYEVVQLGLCLPQRFRFNKYLLKTTDSEILKLRPLNNRENSYEFLTMGRRVLEDFYRDDIRNSNLLKELFGKRNLVQLLRGKNEYAILKLALFQLWFSKRYTGL